MNMLPIEQIREKIYRIRNIEVMLDSDLAELYGVETKYINQAVSRNQGRFPNDFVFELSQDEWDNLKSQNVTSSWGGRRTIPKVFSEQGVYMLATVLKSQQAADVTIAIMRTFTKMRHYAIEYSDLAKQIHELRKEVVANKEWTKERLSAVADAVIMIEDSMGSLEETVMDIKSTSEVEKIGFLRGQKNNHDNS
ncbi:ORF6N domain-containing protein [Sulfuricurvum sp.]|uniref:ORF6N domain-containing protein n=1 Tax=Sulfuricurvum sp. TaxID=2025608 RepID=UPI0025DF943D|nr:ORF6N domain-containing protein [Sulfuricurvum sp.]